MTKRALRYESAPARRAWILSALRTSGFLAVSGLVHDLGVSGMTVRRDLRRLEETGEVSVVRGGVSLRHGILRTPDLLNRAGENADAKRRIALRASMLVRANDTIAVDSGTSAYALAAALPDCFVGSVITPSVPVIQLMLNRPRTRLVGLGGDLMPSSQAFVGPMTVEAASRLRVRRYFLGTMAVDHGGCYVHTDVERPTKQVLMDIADDVVLLADFEKFHKSAPVRLCPLERLTALVTDREPPQRVAAALKAADVKVLIADDLGYELGTEGA